MVDTSAKAIINIIELVLSVIVAGLIGNAAIYSSISKNQFIDAAVYGYTIISILVVAANMMGQKLSKTVRFIIAGVGLVLWVTAGALLLEYVDNLDNLVFYTQELYDRTIAGGIISLGVAVIYILDAFVVFKE